MEPSTHNRCALSHQILVCFARDAAPCGRFSLWVPSLLGGEIDAWDVDFLSPMSMAIDQWLICLQCSRERERERERVCVCVCVCERERVCVCVCVCEREREGG
jgi:hypothetical protein